MHVGYIFNRHSIYIFFSHRYIWDNLNTGYIQGMCDLVAPLLVIFDEGYY